MSDRRKQIEEAAYKHAADQWAPDFPPRDRTEERSFLAGAEWADATPPPENMPRKHQLETLSKELDPLVNLEPVEIPPLASLLSRARTLINDCKNDECTTSTAHMWLLHYEATLKLCPSLAQTPSPTTEGSEDRGT